MRALVKFPHKKKPVERKVHTPPYSCTYINSKGTQVRVIYAGKRDGKRLFVVDNEWNFLYEKEVVAQNGGGDRLEQGTNGGGVRR